MKIVHLIVTLLVASLSGLAVPASAQTQDPAGYRLGTADKVRVTVFGEAELGGEYEVDGSGFLRMNLIGQVRAAGLTIQEFEQSLKAKLEEGYLKDAKVSVEVTNYRPFYIIGEVNKPGEYPYSNDMTILNAVAKAGGYTYRANETSVYIRRNGSTDEVGVPADQSTKINPGDVIRIPERFF